MRAGPPLNSALKPSSRSIVILIRGTLGHRLDLVLRTNLGERINKALVIGLPLTSLYL
jgi:hypothetical protein